MKINSLALQEETHHRTAPVDALGIQCHEQSLQLGPDQIFWHRSLKDARKSFAVPVIHCFYDIKNAVILYDRARYSLHCTGVQWIARSGTSAGNLYAITSRRCVISEVTPKRLGGPQ